MERFGSQLWSSNQHQDERSTWDRVISGSVAGASIGYMGYQTSKHFGVDTSIPNIRAATKYYSSFTPLEVGNTFRIPEWLSPFTTNDDLQLNGINRHTWKEGLSDERSIDYISRVTGRSRTELGKMGILPGVDHGYELTFARDGKGSVGNLLATKEGQSDIFLGTSRIIHGTYEQEGITTNRKSINRAAQAMVATTGVFDDQAPKDFFNGFLGNETTLIPIPSDNLSYARGVTTFEMDRFNRLTQSLIDETIGLDNWEKIVGRRAGFKAGTGSQLFARYGLGAAAVGGGVLALNELDWARRQGGLPTNILASGVVSGGVFHLAHKLGVGRTNALFAATASFFGQVALPGFDKGLMEGAWTTYANFDVLTAKYSPFSNYRRTLEGLAPGISDWKTGAFMAVGATALAHTSFPRYLVDKLGYQNFGLDIKTEFPVLRGEKYYQLAAEQLMMDERHFTGWQGLKNKFKVHGEAWRANNRDARSYYDFFNRVYQSTDVMMDNEPNPLNQQLIGKLSDIHKTHGSSWRGYGTAAAEQLKFAFLGADIGSKEVSSVTRALSYKLPVGRSLGIFAGVMGLHGLLTGSLLGSMESGEGLEDIYSGRKMISVKKSRNWEGGSNPFEGLETEYMRPHAYALMMNRSREKGIWGENEDSYDPISKFFLENFTYHLEQKNYYSRPFPVTSGAFENVPIIGKFLSDSVIGKIIKPARLMHVDEWTRASGNGYQYMHRSKGAKGDPAYGLGAPLPGIPESGSEFSTQLSDYSYQFRELEGITGFVKNTLFGALFGTDSFSSDAPRLQRSGSITSANRSFWETDMGGGLFLNEVIRRALPPDQAKHNRYNPLGNNLPSWLPESFSYGDAYSNIDWGEARLPGAGYAALNPELSGVSPEDYPLIHQYKILADVAPFSSDFKLVRNKIYNKRKMGQTSEVENYLMDQADSLVQEKFNKINFQMTNENALLIPGTGIVRNAFLSAKSLVRGLMEPAEYLIPFGFRPSQKLLGGRDPIAQYEHDYMYGTGLAFWDKPIRDWFRPAFYSALSMIGYNGKPKHVSDAQETDAYFDQLEFVKNMRLAEEAEAQGDNRGKRRFLNAASQTRQGVNPNGDALSIYWALPQKDRPYFSAFLQADKSGRERILEMVPKDQVHLYKSLWSRMDSGQQVVDHGGTYEHANVEYLQSQYSSLTMPVLPPTDWIGWSEEVDMSDIKAKYVNDIAGDLHDYGLWEGDLKKANSQKFLDGSSDFLYQGSLNYERADILNTAKRISRSNIMSVSEGGFSNSFGSIFFGDNQNAEIQRRMSSYEY